MYPEDFQYVDRTHTDKTEALENLKSASCRYFHRESEPSFRTVSLDFHGVDRMMTLGYTFLRVPQTESTRLIFIDIDHKDTDPYFSPIEYGELDSVLSNIDFEEYAIHRSAGASPGSWHVVALMPREVPMDAYQAVAHGYSLEIRGLFAELFGKEAPMVCDPALENNPRQVVFGRPSYPPGPAFVQGSGPAHCQKTGGNPEGRWFAHGDARKVPLNPGGFISELERDGLIQEPRVEMEYAFRAWLPYMRKGSGKSMAMLQPGTRHRIIVAFLEALCDCWASWNVWLRERGLQEYTADDLVATFVFYTDGYTDNGDGFDLSYYMRVARRMSGLSGMTPEDWCRHEVSRAIYVKRTGQPKHRFVSRSYRKDMALSILDSHAEGDRCVFQSRDVMVSELESAWLSVQYLRNAARERGMRVEYGKTRKPRKSTGGSRGRPSSLSLESVLAGISWEVVGGYLFYSGKLDSRTKKFIQRKGYRIMKKNGDIIK